MKLTLSDPATAIATAALEAFAAYCNFLCTPEGQAFAKDVRQVTWDQLTKLIPGPVAAVKA